MLEEQSCLLVGRDVCSRSGLCRMDALICQRSMVMYFSGARFYGGVGLSLVLSRLSSDIGWDDFSGHNVCRAAHLYRHHALANSMNRLEGILIKLFQLYFQLNQYINGA